MGFFTRLAGRTLEEVLLALQRLLDQDGGIATRERRFFLKAMKERPVCPACK